MEFKRCSGILMPISSLPGGYGIGSLGKPARNFVDFLAGAGQTIWQILPVGQTAPTRAAPPLRATPISLIWTCWLPMVC